MKYGSKILTVICAGIVVAISSIAIAQDEAPKQTLFTNVQIFDGVSEERLAGNVLVEGNLIKQISAEAINAPGASVIDGGGGTLMPGLIEAHAHLSLHGDLFQIRNEFNWMYVGAKSGAEATNMLMRGFTTARDAAGPTNGLRKVIDAGHVAGPRIYSAGPAISQTGGHFDIRGLNEPNYYFLGMADPKQFMEWAYLADGVPEVQKAAREVFRKGSSHIKIMAGGGVATVYDPLDGLQFTPEEIRAIVVEAEKVGSYVMAHIYTSEAITIALEAGVKCIDHGMLMDEKTMKLLKKKDAFLVPSLAVGLFTPEELDFAWPTPETKAKGARIIAGMENEVMLAKKIGVKIGFGTDFFGPNNEAFAMQALEFKARAKYFTPYEILVQATSTNAAIVAMSGPMMNPYLAGPLGVIQEGAYADILIVNGNPLDDIELLVDAKSNIPLIMKDGRVYKNEL
ncbi:MAG: amidohydrolase family protein [Gammaproteobacteria bacterium]|nr:MAG: amidohydrolase family protein [Gammaproteobacteria bacterium]RLA37511.1 MAG: amidohydrolase family protein [Gammaproteobacteria bacterium]